MTNSKRPSDALHERKSKFEHKTNRSYWLQVFSEQTWKEFLSAGAKVTGFREMRWPRVRHIRPGDYLLCYLTKIGTWAGALEATSEPFLDDSHTIWRGHFPCRLRVTPVITLDAQNAVPIRKLRDQLSIFQSRNWGVHLMASPRRFSDEDAAIVLREIRLAKADHQNTSSVK